jgi:hypothetical protein
MQWAVLRAIKKYGPCTHSELSFYMAQDMEILHNHKENVRKRSAELFKHGCIRQTGVKECSITHRMAKVWEIKNVRVEV